MSEKPPAVELLGPSSPYKGFNEPPSFSENSPGGQPLQNKRRIWLFWSVFLSCLAGSLLYVWSRVPVYQASATLLTVAPTALGEDEQRASKQHVAIERQTLLSDRMISSLHDLLKARNDSPGLKIPSVIQIHSMLSAEPVPETNLLELRARGSDREVLAPVVNAWTDAYEQMRLDSERLNKLNTSSAIGDEYQGLGLKVETKRKELERFRAQYGIVSKRDSDNLALSRLTGLNTALNKASEEEVQARAQVDTIRSAIARGEPVTLESKETEIASLRMEAEEIRKKLKELDARFKPRFALMEPQLKLLPRQLKKLEAEIAVKSEEGRTGALQDAERKLAIAHQSVVENRRQVEALRGEVAEFTTRYAKYEALQKDLEQLEKLYREKEGHLAEIDVKPVDSYPPLKIVDKASLPIKPLWPDYWRDTGLALGGSLATALLFLLIHEFVTRQERLNLQSSSQSSFRLPDIKVFSVSEELMLKRQQEQMAALDDSSRTASLPDSDSSVPAIAEQDPRELTEAELRLLIDAAELDARQLIGFLLSGVSLDEAIKLDTQNLDFDADLLLPAGAGGRVLRLAPRLKSWLLESGGKPVWSGEPDIEVDDFSAQLVCAAVDAGLFSPSTADAKALNHTYLMYLTRQGLRLADLDRIAGRLGARVLSRYARHSPAGPGLRAEAIALVHPVLVAVQEDRMKPL